MSTTPKLTPAELAHRRRLIQQIRAAHARRQPFVPLAFMVTLVGGPFFMKRAAQITAISERASQTGTLSKSAALILARIELDVLRELGFDPRTEDDPLQPKPETVPPSHSVRDALLAGDAEALLRTALTAGLVPPESDD